MEREKHNEDYAFLFDSNVPPPNDLSDGSYRTRSTTVGNRMG